MLRSLRAGLTCAAITLVPLAARADMPAGMVPAGGSVTFRFTTSVTTPKGTHTGAGTVTVKKTGERAASLTIASDDGNAPRTIPLIVGVDGSIAPDPSEMPAADAAPADPAAKAQAQAFMAEMTIAAHVGIGARKSGGAASYTVPVKIVPVGSGTAMSAQLRMDGTAAQYTGRAQVSTTTQLPSGGSVDPAAIAKTIGVERHLATPGGRLVAGRLMRKKREEEKAAASGDLPDTITLTVTTELGGGPIREVRGVQTDAIAIPRRPVKIESSWRFTRV